MASVIVGMLGKALAGMAIRLFTAKFFEEFFIYALEAGAKASKVTWDDELVEMAKKHLEAKKS